VDVSPLTPGVRAQINTAKEAFAASPDDAVANLTLAKALLAYRIFGAAEGYLRRARALAPDNLEAVYLLGWLHATTGDREAALADFDRALRLAPGHPQSRLRRADALRRLDRLDDAEAAYRDLLKTYPDQPNARFGLGNVLLGQGKYQEAIAILAELTATTGLERYGAAHYSLALAYRHAGDEAKADAHFAAYQTNRNWEPPFDDPDVDQIAAMDRSHQGLYQQSLKEAAGGNWTHAAQLLEEAVRDDPQFLVGHVNLITVYAHLGDTGKVDEHYRKALALSPDSAELQNTQGLVAKVAGRTADATAHFLKAVEVDPSHYTSYENLGLIAFEAGDLDTARRRYEQAAAIAPSSQIAWTMIGTIHLRQGRPEQARAAFLRLVRPGPQAEAVVASVETAYIAAHDRPGWVAFARDAAVRAGKAGMTSLQSRLDRVTP